MLMNVGASRSIIDPIFDAHKRYATRMRRNKPSTPNWTPLLIHVVITLVMIVTGVLLAPWAYRHHRMRMVTSTSLAKRELGLSYVVARAGQDPWVLQETIARLGVEDQTNFLHIVNALDRAGQWHRPPIPDEPWLRWVRILAADPLPQSRIIAAQFIGDLADLANNPIVVETLAPMLADPDPDVRYHALVTVAQLAPLAQAPAPDVDVDVDVDAYKSLIVQTTLDKEPWIARAAWMALGWIAPAHGMTANWRDPPPPVAQAILWATLKTNPKNPGPAIEAIADTSVDSDVRAMAVYALHLSNTPAARDALTGLVASANPTAAETDRLLAWRAILGLGLDPDHAARAVGLPSRLHADALHQPIVDPLILSALYRGLIPVKPFLDHLAQAQPTASHFDPLATLAVLEGLPVGKYHIPIPPDMPLMLRATAAAVTQSPDPDDLYDLFASDTPTLRDLACIVAADRLTQDQLHTLVGVLLADFNDDAKRSGAILAGLTGVQPELLAKKTRDENIWAVRQIHRLGMWMQGHCPEMDHLAPGLLGRDDMPTSTILLAMLHRRHPLAWEFLFDPRSQPLDLIELLDQHRWWRVLKRYLPDDAPPFWVWADTDLEQFQLDVLRSWYMVNRHRLGENKSDF